MIASKHIGLTLAEEEKAKYFVSCLNDTYSLYDGLDILRDLLRKESEESNMFKGCIVMLIPVQDSNRFFQILIQRII